jgi:2-dehydro-3-deoxyphosphooctonate aldolase (KDO 8-P synthase)
MKILKLENFLIGNHEPMTLMGGVNVLESESVVMAVAEKFAETTSSLNINWIFKGSFDKANRSSISSFRGPGLDEGLKMLEKVKSEF